MIRKAGTLLLIMWAIVLVCNGCISAGSKKEERIPAVPVNSPPYIHTVKYLGETLRNISKWYSGDINNWRVLADANPNIDYENISKGSRIFIPETLLKTREPFTEDYIKTYNRKSKPAVKEEKKKPVSKPKPRPKKDEDFDLIGPK